MLTTSNLVFTDKAPRTPAASKPGRRRASPPKIRRRDLTFVLRNLATLVENGLPLAKALATLAQERSLRRYALVLDELRRQVEMGNSFSTALAKFPQTFSTLTVTQIRVAEKSGTLAATLDRVAAQLENSERIKAQIVKKMAYPTVLVVAGSAAVTFMLLFVVPVFRTTYQDAGVPLPAITQVLIAAADWAKAYGWIVPLTLVAAVVTFRRLRQTTTAGLVIDRAILRLPLIGSWLRNLYVLQFIEVLSNMLDAGFTVVEALGASSSGVGNRAVRHSVESLKASVMQGERFSRELDKLGELFPPVVVQLVVVGERTGNLTKTTAHIREHLRREIERQTALMIGTIEPILTIGLAAMIGVVVLAIYLPMFDMIGAMNGGNQ